MHKTASAILAATVLMAGAAAPALAVSHSAAVHRRLPVGSPASIVRAAERGDPRAQAILGFMYEYGRRLPQDFILAAKWYSRAAEQGEPHGQHFLGLLFDKGRGVPEDLVESYKWLNLAAARAGRRDRDHYIRMRDAIASKMDRYQIAEGQRRARLWRPVREQW